MMVDIKSKHYCVSSRRVIITMLLSFIGVQCYPMASVASSDTIIVTNTATPSTMPAQSTSILLRDLLANPVITVAGKKLDAASLSAFYAMRNYSPAWDMRTEESRAAMGGFIKSVADFAYYNGLDIEQYRLIFPTSTEDGDYNTPDFTADLLITDMLLRLVKDLRGDDLHFEKLYTGWHFKHPYAGQDVIAGLADAVAVGKVGEFLTGLLPANIAYDELARTLADYRQLAAQRPWSRVTVGATIRPGERSIRVSQVRARLEAEKYLPPTIVPVINSDPTSETAVIATAPTDDTMLYDNTLKAAVQAYQGRNGLATDGNIGAKTIESMNIPVTHRIRQIMANMERWRQMPESFGDSYVMVNIADATVKLFDGGAMRYFGPVVIGKIDRKTPFINSNLSHVIFNPSWHVPAKIARKDILPKLRRDPRYLEKMAISIRDNDQDPYGVGIDWDNVHENNFYFNLRQSPGDHNSLGRIKFDFDNDFAVYMHGTPHQELFARAERAQSSGCIRLRDPELLAELVLAANPGAWDVSKIRAAIAARQTKWQRISKQIPIYVLYWTVFIGDDGQPNFRSDIYGYD